VGYRKGVLEKCCCEVVECGECLLFGCVMMSIGDLNGSLYISVDAGAFHLATSPSNSEHQQTCHERRGQVFQIPVSASLIDHNG
jgi:hypothetical protein